MLSTHRREWPPFSRTEKAQIAVTVDTRAPHEHGLPGHNWTLKKLRRWVETVLKRTVSRNTLRQILKSAGLSWKKCKKLLVKADPEKRAAFVEQFQALYTQMLAGEVDILYVDESHFHQDMDLGYTWAPTGQPAWRKSISPSLSARINWYGAYDFTTGQALIWHEGKCNGENTAKFLQRMVDWKGTSPHRLLIIWDGASWHRSQKVQAQAKKLGIELFQLPAYSPDLNPIEQLWRWMREDVTQNFCHDTLHDLFVACHAFIARINQDPLAMIKHLWPKFQLDPDYEKLLVST